MNKTRWVILTLALLGTYFLTWATKGDKHLLNQSLNLVWSSDDVAPRAREVQFVVCTNLTAARRVRFGPHNVSAIPIADCARSDTLSLLADAARWTQQTQEPDGTLTIEDGGGLIVAYAEKRLSTPLLTSSDLGFHYYETDYDATRREWHTWAFLGWITIRTSDSGLAELP